MVLSAASKLTATASSGFFVLSVRHFACITRLRGCNHVPEENETEDAEVFHEACFPICKEKVHAFHGVTLSM